MGNTRSGISDEERELAQLSDITYDDDYDSRAQRANKLGYGIDSELSDDKTAVYTKNGSAVVAYRGTKLTSPEDLAADMKIATFQVPEDRVASGREKAAKAKQKYGSVKLTGHSLGGTVANEVSMTTDHEATVFNPGAQPLKRNRKGAKVKIIRHAKDPISMGFSADATNIGGNDFDPLDVVSPALSGYKAHRIDNFLMG